MARANSRQCGDRQWADVAWDETGRVYSKHFGDWYSGELCAYDEAQDVYCAGLDLPNAWSNFAWDNFGRNSFAWNSGSFCLTELGFGAGVNFLQTQRLWQKWHEEWDKECHSKRTEPQPQVLLDYYGIERYPMRAADLRRTHEELNCTGVARNTSSLLELWRELEQYPQRGFFRWQLSPSLRLTLLLADAAQALARLAEQSVDGWYLDGFAIGDNSSMWSEEVFAEVARCTRARALVAGVSAPQLASFSVARKVRDRATSCGFRVHKRARAMTSIVAGMGTSIVADKKTATLPIEKLPRKREVLQGFFPTKNSMQKFPCKNFHEQR